MAASALFRRFAASPASSGKTLIPMAADSGYSWSAMMNGRASESCTRRATLSAASAVDTPGSTRPNSSPPVRATQSLMTPAVAAATASNCEPVAIPQTVLQTGGDFLQHGIAGRRPLRVVDAGEVVDVQHQRRDAALPQHRPFDLVTSNCLSRWRFGNVVSGS